jgi:hypothetical protein
LKWAYGETAAYFADSLHPGCSGYRLPGSIQPI